MGENPGCFCSIVWRSFSTWIPWACHLNWLQDLLQFIAPLSSYFIRFIKHKLKSSRNTKGKRWERKNDIQVFLFLKTTWLFPWAGEVWGRILTVTDGPSPGLLVIPSHLWNPRARCEETTQKRSRVAQCNCHNSHTSPSCGNFVPKMVLNQPSSKTCPSHTSIWSRAKGTTWQTFSAHNLPAHSQESLLLTLLILYFSSPVLRQRSGP